MTMRLEVYKCNICGNIVEILHSGTGTLVCCGAQMQKLSEKVEDLGNEKHVPVIEILNDSIKVKVGSIPHPMEEKHYIEWIELVVDDIIYRKFLKPGDKPEAEFCAKGKKIEAREYCNLHGLWKSK